MIDAALAYAAAGWPVFPCDPRNKRPHPMLGHSGGFHHATLNPADIRDWWTRDPDALVASAASFAIDIDTPDGIDAAGHLGLRAGAIVRTGNGWHAHFAPIPNPSIRRIRGTVAGLTIRPVNKAYVILPPSRHPDGGQYTWIDPAVMPRLAGLPRIPERALNVIAPEAPIHPRGRAPRIQPIHLDADGRPAVPDGTRAHVDRVLSRVRAAEPGRRHPTAVAAAVHLARLETERGLPPGHWRTALEDAALVSGLDDHEVRGGDGHIGLVEWAWDTAA